jgi:hypothetical protein
MTLSVLGLLPLAVGGWLGGELVFVQGVGVEPHTEQQEHAVRPATDGHARRRFSRTA